MAASLLACNYVGGVVRLVNQFTARRAISVLTRPQLTRGTLVLGQEKIGPSGVAESRTSAVATGRVSVAERAIDADWRWR